MTAVLEQPTVRTEPRSRVGEIWRVVRLHAVTPSVFFGIPWIILGAAWLVMIIIGIIAGAAGADTVKMGEGMRYSWAVLSPQWYLVAVGVQAIGLTMSFALGFGATRRDFWLGTGLMFGIVSLLNAIAIATLVQLEKLTNGWWLKVSMFDSLWYGQGGWLVDFYTTFALQLFVLFIGASVTTVFLRWRMRGMLVLAFGAIALALGGVAIATLTQSWPAIFTWFGSIGVVGVFTVVLGLALVFAIGGYVVIRRATPR
ncbi:hypothetical protein EV187_3166 [Agromyces ramosus]|uniref:Uncharacterized protein n=1 Tax=Agromyces ramosus TaxID=33879 RepID=A0A4Q7MCX5_9MICO|nr:hypothetical protein [Agromyces ramosus]RZS64778.1 hypothetical protein EV187_3166 [Agromyces ramosus]